MRDRILTLLETEKISPAKFAEILGVQRSGISHILSGRNLPSLDMLNKILHHFSNLSAEWLLRGQGSIYRDAVNSSEPSLGKNTIITVPDEISINKEVCKDQPLKSDENQTDIENKMLFKETVITPGIGNTAKQIVIFYPDNTFEQFYPR